jgi:hypothetical protein
MTAVSNHSEPSRLAVPPDILRRYIETVNAMILGEAVPDPSFQCLPRQLLSSQCVTGSRPSACRSEASQA